MQEWIEAGVQRNRVVRLCQILVRFAIVLHLIPPAGGLPAPIKYTSIMRTARIGVKRNRRAAHEYYL
jgi:hypothetical protein